MSFNLVNVGIADIGISTAPNILRTILGSCVGICFYEPDKKIGGLSHIMLPSIESRSSSKKKYADSAILLLLQELEKNGAEKRKIIAKIVGGATMFKISNNNIMGDIGKKNIKKVKEVLDELKIRIVAEDLGGDYGRTVNFYTETGEVRIKSIGRGEKVI